MNQANLIGRIGRDAETKHTPSGKAVTTFSLATSDRYKDKEGQKAEKTTWHNIVVWERENLTQYLVKGKEIAVIGKIQNRDYEKDGVKHYVSEVVANMDGGIELLGGGSNGTSNGGARPETAVRAATTRPAGNRNAAPATISPDDDLPF